jgi:hypothetical protein
MFCNSKDIEIRLGKYQFAPDDTIVGTVILKLAKVVKAKGLYASLVVTDKISRTGLGSGGASVSTLSSTREVFRFDLPLDGEREHTQGGEYLFQMQYHKQLALLVRRGCNRVEVYWGRVLAFWPVFHRLAILPSSIG